MIVRGIVMKRILVIFTGGTIGSRVHNSTINVDDAVGYHLIELFKEKTKSDIYFDTLQPMNLLSENCTPKHWEILYDTIKNVDASDYDGIIVTHGSDTLPYTSAVLSFLFSHFEIPIVITASNYALEYKHSNGLDNFTASVDFIVNIGLRGVYTIFQNDKKENRVYLASRLVESDSYTDQFLSYGGIELAEIEDGNLKYFSHPINPTIHQLNTVRDEVLKEAITFNNKVFAIRPYPGLDYECFQFKNKPNAIVHSLYHSGTGCIYGENYSLPNFIKKCKDDGIDFYLMSFKDIDSDLYLSSRELLEYGAIPLQNISFEAAYAKLTIAYNQNTMIPEKYMKKELFFEFLPKHP